MRTSIQNDQWPMHEPSSENSDAEQEMSKFLMQEICMVRHAKSASSNRNSNRNSTKFKLKKPVYEYKPMLNY